MSNLACAVPEPGEVRPRPNRSGQGLEVGRRVLGEEHRETLDYVNNLAWPVRAPGRSSPRPNAPRPRRWKSAAASGGRSTPTHSMPWTLWRDLYYVATRSTPEAEPLWSRRWKSSRRILGEEHADTLETHAQPGVALSRHRASSPRPSRSTSGAGSQPTRPGGGAPRHARAVNIWPIVPSTGEVDRGRAALVEALEGRRRILGEEHPDTIYGMDELADLYQRDVRRLPEEIDLLEQAWARARKQPDLPAGGGNLDTVQLGVAYEQAGQFAKAESLYREALELHPPGAQRGVVRIYRHVSPRSAGTCSSSRNTPRPSRCYASA